ncbi:MAG TPA: hypothetical protein VH583_05560 [Vicinamibacterales bacterium]|jgi:Tol biopolymer transport system component
MRMRWLVLFGLMLAAIFAWTRIGTPADPSRFTWIATAHQFGPVSYRDPAGAISPDGQWIAYSEGRFLRVRPVNGGPSMEFPPGRAQIRNLAWSPDSRSIVADGDMTPASWAIYDRASGTRQPLDAKDANISALRQLAWSADGRLLTGVLNDRDGNSLRTVAVDGARIVTTTPMQPRINSPVRMPGSDRVACIAVMDGHPRVTAPCGERVLDAQPAADAFGPLAFSPDGSIVYASFANAAGTVDLWAVPTSKGRARQLTSFSRDSYAPSVASDGSVVFKVQSYRTVVSIAPAAGGVSQPLATFQSETPSWDPTGAFIGITYGTWRRIPDDAKYPDIAQDAGIIGSDPAKPAAAPARVVHDSASEDQSLCWSPNGRWIAFHSHKDQSDDIWLRAADNNTETKRVTTLGRGTEAGWPRWSRDGRSILFTGVSRQTHRTVMYVVDVDQESGLIVSSARELPVDGLDVDVFHAEWAEPTRDIVVVGKEGPGRHVIFTVPREGGTAHVVYRFSSEHDFPGIGVSPDGKDAAFIAPADGYFQVFRIPLAGGTPVQVTHDPSNKTQPSWSPDGKRIAFTVWNYDADFYIIRR